MHKKIQRRIKGTEPKIYLFILFRTLYTPGFRYSTLCPHQFHIDRKVTQAEIMTLCRLWRSLKCWSVVGDQLLITNVGTMLGNNWPNLKVKAPTAGQYPIARQSHEFSSKLKIYESLIAILVYRIQTSERTL